jgi:hypothetical protein
VCKWCFNPNNKYPKYCTQYILEETTTSTSSSVVSINNGDATYTYVKAPSTRKSAAVTLVNDYLFCVNSSAELFQVNPLNGQLTYLSDMPMGSVTCAVDQANKCVFNWK